MAISDKKIEMFDVCQRVLIVVFEEKFDNLQKDMK
jgi:hypothetical protein